MSIMFLMNYDLKIAIWNARGLNARAWRTTIRLLITTGASIVCIQETKMELICSSTVLETLGSEFDEYVYLPATGTRGGILLAWKSWFITLSDQSFTTNTLSVKVSTPGVAHWWLTVVYGPQADAAKIAFMQELRDVRAGCPGPWMLLCGDFNLIYRDETRTTAT